MTNEITRRDFNKLMAEFQSIKQYIIDNQAASDLVDEEQAALLLKCSIRTIQNKVYNGEISASEYTTSIVGKRFYKKSYLMGLKTA